MKNSFAIQVNLAYPWKSLNNKATTTVTMMTAGIRTGSQGSLLWTSEVLSKNPERWNQIPVVISHPQVDGFYVSVNHNETTKAGIIGYIKNARYDGVKKALKAEIEVNLSNPDIPKLDKIREVSIGVFSDNQSIVGTHGGQTYTGIVKSYQPDHLALLDNEVGACSWSDGCGLHVNQAFQDELLKAFASEFSKLFLIQTNTEVNMTNNLVADMAEHYNKSIKREFQENIGDILYPNDVIENLNINAEADFDDKGVLYPPEVYQRTKPPVKADTKTKNDENIGEILMPIL